MVSDEGADRRDNDPDEPDAGAGPEGRDEEPERDPNAPPPGSIRELILASAPPPVPLPHEREDEEKPSPARRALTAAFLIGAALIAYLVLTAGEPYKVKAEFHNASQLVEGNEVVVGGAHVGSVEKIELGDHGVALVTFSVGEEHAPLRRGTVATIRSPALSTVAGRQIQLTLPPANSEAPEIPDGGTLTTAETVSAVDLDELFNTLDPKTVEDFKHVIQGFERSYEGIGTQANRGIRYLNPLLSTSRRVFAELASDERALESLVVDTAKLSGALADRSSDLSALIGSLDSMMNAIGDRKLALAEGVSRLPSFMRSANTTFVNLRAALDDLDPLVAASRPAARELQPFLRELRGAARDLVPTVEGLDRIVKDPGEANDLVELTAIQPKLARNAIGSGSPDCGPGAENPEDLQVAADDDFSQGAFGESVCALRNSLGMLSFFRAYTPEVLGWFNSFSHIGNEDATGTSAVLSVTLNAFSPSIALLPDLSDILDPDETLASLNVGDVARCPGRNERPIAGDDSIPFTDNGALVDGSRANGECDPQDGAAGP